VRFTNRDFVCQIVAADLTHDKCIAVAYSHELPRYGISVGLTNYAAAYATGLLLARRVNDKFKLNYAGVKEANGEDFEVEADESGPKPFHALLDVGLLRTSTGARVFGALKGAVDGGLDIPHNNHRFPGSKRSEDGEWTADPEVHRKYIFGGHVKEYMAHLKEEDADAYARQFSQYIDKKIGPDQIEGLYKKAHAAIRADPFKKRDALEFGYFAPKRAKPKDSKQAPKKHVNKAKLSNKSRKARVRQILTHKGVKSIGPTDA